MTDNIFERASRKTLRFSSPKGYLATDDLWQLPLVSRSSTQVNLDDLAKAVSKELKEAEEESFVQESPNRKDSDNRLRLDILKHIIAYKLILAEKAENRAEKLAKAARLKEVLAKKQDESLSDLTEEEILAELKALDS